MLGQVRQMMGMVKAAQNPQAMLQQIAQNNPKMKQAMDLVQQYGGDPNRAFHEVARQMGIDPNEIINMLK